MLDTWCWMLKWDQSCFESSNMPYWAYWRCSKFNILIQANKIYHSESTCIFAHIFTHIGTHSRITNTESDDAICKWIAMKWKSFLSRSVVFHMSYRANWKQNFKICIATRINYLTYFLFFIHFIRIIIHFCIFFGLLYFVLYTLYFVTSAWIPIVWYSAWEQSLHAYIHAAVPLKIKIFIFILDA